MKLRKELFVPAHRWSRPTGDEVKQLIMEELGMSEVDVGIFLDLKQPKVSRGNSTVYRWKAGLTPIPYPSWCLLAHKAGYGVFWK